MSKISLTFLRVLQLRVVRLLVVSYEKELQTVDWLNQKGGKMIGKCKPFQIEKKLWGVSLDDEHCWFENQPVDVGVRMRPWTGNWNQTENATVQLESKDQKIFEQVLDNHFQKSDLRMTKLNKQKHWKNFYNIVFLPLAAVLNSTATLSVIVSQKLINILWESPLNTHTHYIQSRYLYLLQRLKKEMRFEL